MKALTLHLSPKYRRWLFVSIFLALSAYVLVPQTDMLRHSLKIVQHAQFAPAGLAVLITASTFFVASTTYHLLALKSLTFWRTVLVSLANMFTNRILPAGTGTIAMFFLYLRANKHSASQAGTVIAVNNTLGLLGHVSLLGLLLLFGRSRLPAVTLPTVRPLFLLIAAGIVGTFFVIVLTNRAWHKSIVASIREIYANLLYYRMQPHRIIGAFTSSMLLTVLNAGVLWLCAISVGANIDPVTALAVFTGGIIVGTITPTPGGLGGTEAGLLAGLLAYHVSGQSAFAVVILFRLISYWLTLVIGAMTYVYVQRRGYLSR